MQGEYGDVSERQELRKRLNCKSFEWYMTNIFPELFIPGDAVASGEVGLSASAVFSWFDGNWLSLAVGLPFDTK